MRTKIFLGLVLFILVVWVFFGYVSVDQESQNRITVKENQSVQEEAGQATSEKHVNPALMLHGVPHLSASPKETTTAMPENDWKKLKSKTDEIVQQIIEGKLLPNHLGEEEKSVLQTRQKRMKALIVNDPKKALENRLPVSFLKAYSGQLEGLTEKWVEGEGTLALIAECSEGIHEYRYDAIFEKQRLFLKASVYGRRQGMLTLEQVPLYGIAIDDVMAVHEDPLRLLEEGEDGHTEGRLTYRLGARELTLTDKETQHSLLKKVRNLEANADGPFVDYTNLLQEELP